MGSSFLLLGGRGVCVVVRERGISRVPHPGAEQQNCEEHGTGSACPLVKGRPDVTLLPPGRPSPPSSVLVVAPLLLPPPASCPPGLRTPAMPATGCRARDRAMPGKVPAPEPLLRDEWVRANSQSEGRLGLCHPQPGAWAQSQGWRAARIRVVPLVGISWRPG